MQEAKELMGVVGDRDSSLDRIYLTNKEIEQYSREHTLGIEDLDELLSLYSENGVWIGHDRVTGKEKLMTYLVCENDGKILPYSIDSCFLISKDSTDPIYLKFRDKIQHTCQGEGYFGITHVYSIENLPLPPVENPLGPSEVLTWPFTEDPERVSVEYDGEFYTMELRLSGDYTHCTVMFNNRTPWVKTREFPGTVFNLDLDYHISRSIFDFHSLPENAEIVADVCKRYPGMRITTDELFKIEHEIYDIEKDLVRRVA